MSTTQHKFAFSGRNGQSLAARLDLPAGPIRGYALFAHCFTCSKDIQAARRIASGLAHRGIAVVRFDFTGLGSSAGDFANTNFSSNIEDILAAIDQMRTKLQAPSIMIGHSLGGAAVLAAAPHVPEVKAVATIGAPADVDHVLHNFGTSLEKIEADGEAEVLLGGRTFTVKRDFIINAKGHQLETSIAVLKKPLLILHAPRDETVGIENASRIFSIAKHPKSFVSLDDADHLLSKPADGDYAAGVISAWASRYVSPSPTEPPAEEVSLSQDIIATETGLGRFQNTIVCRQHQLIADEPKSVGGLDSGPGPYDYLSVALAACTSMTLRMYADHKNLELGQISVTVNHGKVAADHCADCNDATDGRAGRIDKFQRTIRVSGEIGNELSAKLLQIADKCPVHKTLHAGAAIVTDIAQSRHAPATPPDKKS